MPSETALPGFDHLLEVCRRKGLDVKQEPPLASGAHPVSPTVAGQGMDPQLAAVHTRLRYLWVRDGLYLFLERHPLRPDLHAVNAEWRTWEAPFGSLLVFAKDDRLAYCYALLPPAPGQARGPRPVVWVDVYEDLYALPVASSLDAFLDTFARFLDAPPEEPRWKGSGGLPLPAFPWSASALIARDTALMKLLRAGELDFLFQHNARARDWVAAHRGAA